MDAFGGRILTVSTRRPKPYPARQHVNAECMTASVSSNPQLCLAMTRQEAEQLVKKAADAEKREKKQEKAMYSKMFG